MADWDAERVTPLDADTGSHERLQFDADVRVLSRPDGQVLLVGNTSAVRLSAAAASLAPFLVRGTSLAALSAMVRSQHPSAADTEAKLLALVVQLRASGLLAKKTHDPRVLPKPFFKIDTSRLSARLATQANHLTTRSLLGVAIALVLASAAGGAGLVLSNRLASVREDLILPEFFHVVSAFLITISVHEIGHLIAASAVGVIVPWIGVKLSLRGGRAFAATPGTLAVPPLRRVWIPLGGPLGNAVSAGVASWGLLLVNDSGTVFHILTWLLAFSCFSLAAETSPLFRTDGSRALEAILDDEFARSSALSLLGVQRSSSRGVRWYRAMTMAHTAAVAALLWFVVPR